MTYTDIKIGTVLFLCDKGNRFIIEDVIGLKAAASELDINNKCVGYWIFDFKNEKRWDKTLGEISGMGEGQPLAMDWFRTSLLNDR